MWNEAWNLKWKLKPKTQANYIWAQNMCCNCRTHCRNSCKYYIQWIKVLRQLRIHFRAVLFLHRPRYGLKEIKKNLFYYLIHFVNSRFFSTQPEKLFHKTRKLFLKIISKRHFFAFLFPGENFMWKVIFVFSSFSI